MINATKPGIEIIQSFSAPASHWVKHVEFENVIAVWPSVCALKTIHAHLVVSCIYATAVFGNERPAITLLTFNLLCLKQKNNICFL